MLVTAGHVRRPVQLRGGRRPQPPATAGRIETVVAVGHLGVELFEVADVVVVDVHVHESVQGPVLGEHLAGQAGIAAHQVGEHLSDGRALGDHRRPPAGVLAQHRGQPHFDGHGVLPAEAARHRMVPRGPA